MLDQGEIVERGTHDELLALGGAYQRLYESGLFGESSSIRPNGSEFLSDLGGSTVDDPIDQSI